MKRPAEERRNAPEVASADRTTVISELDVAAPGSPRGHVVSVDQPNSRPPGLQPAWFPAPAVWTGAPLLWTGPSVPPRSVQLSSQLD